MGEPLFVLEGIEKRYDGRLAVAVPRLEVAAGKTLVLLGTSGSGKSTLLRILGGLVAPDRGEVRHSGPPGAIGFVVQGGGLFPHLTARGNAALAARHRGWSRERIDARVGELAALARLAPALLARWPSQLSGGERQRVSLVRALVLDPRVLLLDEPLGALDPITRHELQDDLRAAFAALGKTVVLVTHDLAEAAFFAHRVALLSEGRIMQEGTVADLVQRPADPFVTRFVNAQRRSFEGAEGPA